MGLFDLLFGKTTESKSITLDTERRIRSEWDNIRILISGGTPSQLRQALIAADKCLDNALREAVAGESFAERMKNVQTRFDRDAYQQIWAAHKVRNNLVHEAGYEPPHFVIKESIESLRMGLAVLGIRL